MTTIAYKDGIIAYDSRCSEGDLILSDSFDKKQTVEGVHFFLSGAVPDFPDLIKTYFDGEFRDFDCRAFVVDEGDLLEMGSSRDEYWVVPLDFPRAIGSGGDFAIAAMDMGADAKTAVKQAMKRDPFTGGRVRTFKV